MSAEMSEARRKALAELESKLFEAIVQHFERNPQPQTYNEVRKAFKHSNPLRKALLEGVFMKMAREGMFNKIPSEPGKPGRPTVRYEYVG